MSTNEPVGLGDRETTKHLGPRWRSTMGAGLLAGVLAVGAAAGAGGMQVAQRFRMQPVLLLQPVAINALQDGAPAAVNGQVNKVFGNTFVLTDATGRTLVDTGRRGEGLTIVAPEETVIVQGRFERGKLHAQVVVHTDGRYLVEVLSKKMAGPVVRSRPATPRSHGIRAGGRSSPVFQTSAAEVSVSSPNRGVLENATHL